MLQQVSRSSLSLDQAKVLETTLIQTSPIDETWLWEFETWSSQWTRREQIDNFDPIDVDRKSNHRCESSIDSITKLHVEAAMDKQRVEDQVWLGSWAPLETLELLLEQIAFDANVRLHLLTHLSEVENVDMLDHQFLELTALAIDVIADSLSPWR